MPPVISVVLTVIGGFWFQALTVNWYTPTKIQMPSPFCLKWDSETIWLCVLRLQRLWRELSRLHISHTADSCLHDEVKKKKKKIRPELKASSLYLALSPSSLYSFSSAYFSSLFNWARLRPASDPESHLFTLFYVALLKLIHMISFLFNIFRQSSVCLINRITVT